MTTHHHSPSLERFYVSSSITESREETRSALILNLAIVIVLLALIGIGSIVSNHEVSAPAVLQSQAS